MNVESTPSTRTTVIVPPEGGETLHAFGDSPCIKLNAEHTGGRLSLALNTTPPGGGPPPHLHRNEEEIFIPVEGRLRFFADGKWTEALAPGSVVFLPRGQVHTFQNVGDTPAKAWIIATPSGFETFFSKCARLFGAGGAPDLTQIVNISTEHGIEYVPPLGSEPPPAAATAPVHV